MSKNHKNDKIDCYLINPCYGKYYFTVDTFFHMSCTYTNKKSLCEAQRLMKLAWKRLDSSNKVDILKGCYIRASSMSLNQYGNYATQWLIQDIKNHTHFKIFITVLWKIICNLSESGNFLRNLKLCLRRHHL